MKLHTAPVKSWHKRVEFWLLLFFVIRLVGIVNPPLETGHNWRQVTGLMVARNFLEVDANILYPRVDDNQGRSGIIAMEFPLLNYAHFGVAQWLGYDHWYSRLINLIISTLGIYFFYRLVFHFFGHSHALAAALCLSGSIWFAFSRKTMPDTFCIAWMLIGLYMGVIYLERGRLISLGGYVIFTTFGILCKIPAGIYMALLPLLLVLPYTRKCKQYLLVSTLIPLGLTYVWYFFWNPYLIATYGGWYNIGMPFSEGFREILGNLGATAERFYFSAFNGYVFFIASVWGLILAIRKRAIRILLIFLYVFVVFVLYMFKSGFFFHHHNYYIIPFVPMMAFTAGYAISTIRSQWIFSAVLFLGTAEGILNQQHDFFIKPSERYKMTLEAIADSITQRNDLIVINGNDNPQQLYLAHRKGWICQDAQLTDAAYLDALAKQGCKYAFVNRQTYPGEIAKELIYEDEHFRVYQLQGPSE